MYANATAYQTLTIPQAAELGDYGVYVNLANLNAAMHSRAGEAADFVFTDANDTKLKSVVDTYNAVADTGVAWFKASLSDVVNNTFRVQVGTAINTTNDPTMWSDMNIVLRYPLNEASGNAINAANAGTYDGTVSGCTYGIAGKIGLGYEFDGNNDSITCGDVTQLNSVQKFTISCWANQDVLGATDTLFDKLTDSTHRIRIYTSGLGTVFAAYNGGSTNYGNFDYTTVVSAGEWFLIHFAFDGTQSTNATKMRQIINGVNRTLSFGGTIITTTANLAGTNAVVGASSGAWDGKVDEFRIRTISVSNNRATTEYAIQNHDASAYYTLGSVVYPATGASWRAKRGKFGYSRSIFSKRFTDKQ